MGSNGGAQFQKLRMHLGARRAACQMRGDLGSLGRV
jgi:hypothetical protein